MSVCAEMNEMTRVSPEGNSSTPNSIRRSTGSDYSCDRLTPECNPSFDNGYCGQVQAASQQNSDGFSMGQCIRNAYGKLYTDPEIFTNYEQQHLSIPPEQGCRGGDTPSSPSSVSDISSCLSAGDGWVSAPQPGNPGSSGSGLPYSAPPLQTPVCPNPNAAGVYPTYLNNSHLTIKHQQAHTFGTSAQQVPPYHTIYPSVSPGQIVTVPTEHTCQVGAFDTTDIPSFIMGLQNNHPNLRNNNPVNLKPKRKRVINKVQRKAANIRERKRMNSLNEAFDALRTKIPKFSYEKKMSRIETLRLAITYISFMSDVLQGADPADVKLPKPDKGDVGHFSAANFNFHF